MTNETKYFVSYKCLLFGEWLEKSMFVSFFPDLSLSLIEELEGIIKENFNYEDVKVIFLRKDDGNLLTIN